MADEQAGERIARMPKQEERVKQEKRMSDGKK
jgi:hypothetical protein